MSTTSSNIPRWIESIASLAVISTPHLPSGKDNQHVILESVVQSIHSHRDLSRSSKWYWHSLDRWSDNHIHIPTYLVTKISPPVSDPLLRPSISSSRHFAHGLTPLQSGNNFHTQIEALLCKV